MHIVEWLKFFIVIKIGKNIIIKTLTIILILYELNSNILLVDFKQAYRIIVLIVNNSG